jgi:4-carboxymuconolactone decarboxylase
LNQHPKIKNAMKITSGGSQPTTNGAGEYLTGEVQVQQLFNAHEPSRTSGGRVMFQPFDSRSTQ